MIERSPSKRQSLLKLLTGSPADCMEVAKKIIGRQIPADQTTLAKIARDKSLQTWQRIAAVYALGFLGNARIAETLGEIASDSTEELAVRSHAAEALGNLGDGNMTGLLREILKHKPPKELRESCNYALQELGA
jgi:HEAT repeat protein